jgi:hypothetical protein
MTIFKQKRRVGLMACFEIANSISVGDLLMLYGQVSIDQPSHMLAHFLDIRRGYIRYAIKVVIIALAKGMADNETPVWKQFSDSDSQKETKRSSVQGRSIQGIKINWFQAAVYGNALGKTHDLVIQPHSHYVLGIRKGA